jgi:hypothetical protein
MCTISLKAAVLPGHQLTDPSEEEEELHLALRLKMSGAVPPLLPLYACMALTGTTLSFHFLKEFP